MKVLDSGARGSTTTFTERGIGDVLIAWENEALPVAERTGQDKVRHRHPAVSILAEPPVAVVDRNVDKHGTRKQAQAYLDFLYTPRARPSPPNYYRPRDPKVAAQFAKQFPGSSSSRSTSCSARGGRHRRSTSTMAASSTRSRPASPAEPRRRPARGHTRPTLPGAPCVSSIGRP